MTGSGRSVAAVERDGVLAFDVEPLQWVHVVGEGGAVAGSPKVVVPARPRPAAGQQRDVGVQGRDVRLVADRAEDLVLGRTGVGEQRQRLVAVAGEDHPVEALGRRRPAWTSTPSAKRTILRHRRARAHPLGSGATGARRSAGAARDRPPRGRPPTPNRPWLSKNPASRPAGKLRRCAGIGRPDRRAEGTRKPLDERRRSCGPRGAGPARQRRTDAVRARSSSRCRPVEPQHVAEHPVERGRD